jgi:hypothetical protein
MPPFPMAIEINSKVLFNNTKFLVLAAFTFFFLISSGSTSIDETGIEATTKSSLAKSENS